METLSLHRDWYELLVALIDHRVRFLIVGGHAVAAHGEPRFTKDLDLFVDATRANGARLNAALIEFGFGAHAPRAEDIATPGPFWIFGRPPLQVDILTQIPAVRFTSAWKRRSDVPIDPVRVVGVLSREDLIANKRACGRPQDLADAANLERVLKPGAADPRAPRRGPATRGPARSRRAPSRAPRR
jgi:hypothetical protein